MPSAESGLLIPDWDLPAGIGAAITTREGGVSLPPYEHNNLALHVADDAARVRLNRQCLWQQLPGVQGIQWLSQVHGTTVIKACGESVVPEADAQFSDRAGLACAILTADCLPVLFCAADGSQVAAAHAGWRGLCDGVIEATVAHFTSKPNELIAYLGPAIGPSAFEVGAEVRAAFMAKDPNAESCFIARGDKYLADIIGLAKLRLKKLGITQVYSADICTVLNQDYFSYRRDKITGRMASLIWLKS